jgi:uncharacterized protein involved in exopolysaccharide biosynthesis
MTDGTMRGTTARQDGGSIFHTLTVLLRHKSLFVGVPVVFIALAVLLNIVQTRKYVSESRFVAQTSSSSSTSQLAGIAAQFGVRVNAFGSNNQSVGFYADLIRTPELLGEVAVSTFEGTDRSGVRRKGTLLDLYGIKGPSLAARTQSAVQRLNADVGVATSLTTGLVTLTVSAPDPGLAVQINQRILQLVDEYNQEKRESSARMERTFVQGRMNEAKTELRRAELAHASFLQRNRRYVDASDLRIEETTLQRQASLAQDIYNSLAQSYEEARINEVRNTPVISVVSRPEKWVRRTSRGIVGAAVLGALFGLAAAALIVSGLEYMKKQSTERPDEYGDLVRELARVPLLGRFLSRHLA